MARSKLAALMLATLTLMVLPPHPAAAQVTFERLLNAADEPHNWLTYSGDYSSSRHTTLDQITLDNVDRLELQWVFQAQSLQVFQTTPLVVDGIMYITEAPNTVLALDAKLGRVFWRYEYTPSPESRPCCGRVNRGVAILGDTLFMGTIDAQLVAVDAVSGRPIWQTSVADPGAGYALTLAPLIVKDKVIVSVAGGEYGIRGFISAYDPETGEEEWRFYTIPGPGEPGHDTWEGDDWRYGGASAWITGSYDPDVDLIYWGIGNPGPDWNPAQRPGDNLYSDSVVALDPDTGELEWYFQFTPNDPYDYDSVQVPVLVDFPAQDGGTLKLMLWGNRNGFFYVLDRETGQFINGQPFIEQTWAEGLDDNGRPIFIPQEPGATTYPGVQGGTNWFSPSFSPRTGLFYIPAWEDYATVFLGEPQEYVEGESFLGGRLTEFEDSPEGRQGPGMTRGPINDWTSVVGRGAVIALDGLTGEPRWKFEMTDVIRSGLLTTAGDLLFSGARSGYFQALHAATGELLWKVNLGAQILNGPMTYEVDGRQYVAIISGHALTTFALRD